MRSRWNLLGDSLAGLLALLGIAIGIPVNVVSGYLPAAVISSRVLWIGLTVGGAALIVVIKLVLQRSAWVARRVFLHVPSASGWIDRAELREVVTALTAGDDGTVALTTGLIGAGGFGKTMLAARACRHPKVKRRFRAIVWITVGRDLSSTALATRISEIISGISGESVTFASLEEAGQALTATLGPRGRVLLVADDVWTASQMKPFSGAAKQCRLLVTTRRPSVLPGAGVHAIWVDAVPAAVARRLLNAGLPTPPMSPQLEQQLLDLTGGWPLLLSLLNRRLGDDLRRTGTRIDVAAADAADRLRHDGPTALDVSDSDDRQMAVSATIGYSLDLLKPDDRDRFLELGIFPEDVEIPLLVVTLLWQGSAGLDEAATQKLVDQLERLSLLSHAYAADVKVIVLHDVIRDFARSRLGSVRNTSAHAALLNMARLRIPAGSAESADPAGACAAAAWWRLPETAGEGYLWPNLTYHLEQAELTQELDSVCCDLRFVVKRIQGSGLSGAESDLKRSEAPLARQLRLAIAQNATLLEPLQSSPALLTTLTSRLGSVPAVAGQLPAITTDLDAWAAWPDWQPPDQSRVTFRYILNGHEDYVKAVAIAPDGSWFATGSDDKTVRIWAADGTHRRTLTGHEDCVNAVAIAPDSTWLATGSDDKTVRIWAADGTHRRTLTGHEDCVNAVAIAPDGSWLATGSDDKTVRIWAADGTPGDVLVGHRDWVRAVAIAPDGTWLATGSDDKTVRIWAADGSQYRILAGHKGRVNAVAIAPDSTWLATGSDDKTVRIWAADGTHRRTLTGHKDCVNAVAIAPDASWLATGSDDKTVRIWAADGTPGDVLVGHRDWVRAVAIAPDGTWLATGSDDKTAGIWAIGEAPSSSLVAGHRDPGRALAVAPDGSWLAVATKKITQTWFANGTFRAALVGHKGRVNAVAIAPDGTWLATTSDDKTVRIWAADGTHRHTLTGHKGRVNAVAIAPDGTWLATTSDDGTVRLWDVRGSKTPKYRDAIAGHKGRVNAVAIAPDGTWLATTSDDGTVRLWDVRGSKTPKYRDAIAGHKGRVNAVAIAPDGTWLATTSKKIAHIRNLNDSSRTALTAHDCNINTVAVSPGGSWLATVTEDGTISIWAAPTTGTNSGRIAEMRVNGTISDCCWLPNATGLYLAGAKGIYKFSLVIPGTQDGGRKEPSTAMTASEL